MSRKRLGRLQRAATIIPLALLSAAWTASVAGIGGVTAPVVAAPSPGQVTDGTSVPEESIEDPASLSDPAEVEGLNGGNAAGIVNAASTNAIPAAALAAYQRAETVINSADKTCNITWQLIAAIGRVESDHGRFGGNVLNDDGVATPGIYGIPLNGKNGTKAISDTDAGVYDNDTQWDRAVGPMQFIPSTWQVVGVDADDDASRNPQDIDDAALAAAVYLCSGDGDLSTVAGQRAAVFRYNHSDAYVDLVLRIMNAYLEGDFTSVPNNTTAAGYVVPEPPSFNVDGPKTTKGRKGNSSTGGSTGGSNGGSAGGSSTGGGKLPEPIQKGAEAVKETVETIDEGVGTVTSNLIAGLLGPLTKAEARSECQAAYPKLTQSLQLLNCLLSYGLGK
ncbi:transglycosylase protein with SLT domain [Nocardioides sp. J9]|uniref:lytic murein transglycosylase n=1 Tax=Nocardioides sp. J9 TaxID=935844 RepID=UPI00119E07C5|nr:lytic murein transglycosylase [Nocardioides sp. J9]TWG90575.1 transglycosylase protein with SLT domain [Nocardioides sp. J9]